jgi:oxygen-independent coproporphyrinogen-3 oxidase
MNVVNISEELDYKMYETICDRLKNFNHYEISNFGKIKSRHNLTYWNNEEYYGFGLGASGYIDGVRYSNTKSFNSYINGCYRISSEKQTNKIKIENEFILGLRKLEGIDIDLFKKKYDIDIINVNNIERLINERKLIIKGNRLSVNPEYLYVSNEILYNFID